MKGILLAGGNGTRLQPMTNVVSKHLLPVYDKPMIYYPLSTLLLAGIREILLISTPASLPDYRRLLGDGEAFGVRITYLAQPSPDGIAQAFLLGRPFIGDDACCLILGDNLFYGNGMTQLLESARRETAEKDRAVVFGCYVNDPGRFGVLALDQEGKVADIEEKPKAPKSNYAVTGLYFYPPGVSDLAETLRPSARNELEITSLNRLYLRQGRLSVRLLGRGYTWMDVGTADSLTQASAFVQMLHARQDAVIAAPEEIAYRKGWISRAELTASAEKYVSSGYGAHLAEVAAGKIPY
ncbi:MAG: glucose-1-phosphate thymidylyltransferase RfbA [Clostridia bacterium]|nr:glucose-1-phosphate thymidylyltransferase RfbA [Clostridia bacterium]MBR0537144.1 glucose-1-phosphate thymidylyltransferase RfbA [Clostridia bacterium]